MHASYNLAFLFFCPHYYSQAHAPLLTPVTDESFYLLGRPGSMFDRCRLPVVQSLSNRHSVIVSLSDLCKWIAGRAEAMGVDIFAGFSATEVRRALLLGWCHVRSAPLL